MPGMEKFPFVLSSTFIVKISSYCPFVYMSFVLRFLRWFANKTVLCTSCSCIALSPTYNNTIVRENVKVTF